MANRSSRKKRKRRSPAAKPPPRAAATAEQEMARGYERSRRRDEAARAALKPLRPGERPTAVTVGAIVAAIFAVANAVATIVGFESDDGRRLVSSILGTVILVVVAVGMWRARYWAVLGMQALLAITVIFGCLALMTAANLAAVLLAVAIVVLSGTLFWFLVKAMARIQMPVRPGSEPRR